jgi:hypothetical protein
MKELYEFPYMQFLLHFVLEFPYEILVHNFQYEFYFCKGRIKWGLELEVTLVSCS